MMMMMFLHCNQRLLTSELYLTSGRVLSIQSNPYQALYVNCQRPVKRLVNLMTISNCKNMHRNDVKIILQLCCIDILFIAAYR